MTDMTVRTITAPVPVPVPLRPIYRKWPTRRFERVLLRLSIATGYFLIAVLLGEDRLGGDSGNAVLLNTFRSLDFTQPISQWLPTLYPPITYVLSVPAQPFGLLGLSALGSLVMAALVHHAAEFCRHQHLGRTLTIICVVSLAVNPFSIYLAVANFGGVLTLQLFFVALIWTMRFAQRGVAADGFQAGILLALASLTEFSGVVFSIVIALTVPFVPWGAHQRGAKRTTVFILLTPVLAVVGTWLVLLWFAGVFRAGTFSLIEMFSWFQPVSVFGTIVATYSPLILIPPICAATFVLILRKPGLILCIGVLFAAQLVALTSPFILGSPAGQLHLSMALIAVAAITPVSSRLRSPHTLFRRPHSLF